MTIKDLREILIHFQDREYDDYEVELWDYKHQLPLKWNVSHGFSKPDKRLTFPVDVPYDEISELYIENNNGTININ
jgi:hypothetical protein